MQRGANSAQGFFVKRKVTTKNFQSVNIRKQSNSSKHQHQNLNKTEVRNTASMYITAKNRSMESVSEKRIEASRPINTATNGYQRSKSVYRYKRLNFSQHKETKYQSYGSSSIQDFRRRNQRQQIMTRVKQNENLTLFLSKVQQLQSQYIADCVEEQYQKAADIIIQLMNYTVDLNLVEQFSIALKALGDFYLQCGRVNEGLFYYNEARESALLLEQPILLIESLIGIAKCCSKGNLQKQAISVLKKALQYSWFHDKKELELQLYDQMGQKYYHLGDINKAKKYHLRYVNSIYEPGDSAHKSLSKQRIRKNQQINIEMKYSQLSILFLVHLKIPIRTLKEVPPIYSSSQGNQKLTRVRDHFNISKKYFTYFQDMDMWVKNILKTWFFAEEMDEPPLPSEDWTAPMKMKKFAYIDFKLNQHLKKFSYNVEPLDNSSKKEIRYKESLEQKIQRKVRQPGIDTEWYEKMVQQIVRDHKNKLLNVRNAVRMRGYNKPSRPGIQPLKQIYNKFFQRRAE